MKRLICWLFEHNGSGHTTFIPGVFAERVTRTIFTFKCHRCGFNKREITDYE